MKIALLVGVAYLGTSGQLNGTTMDVMHMENMLETHLGYPHDEISVLAESAVYRGSHAVQPPTRDNIVNGLTQMATKCQEDASITEVFFQYSGHGTHIHDKTGDELDRRDECLVPVDHETAGYLVDDDLKHLRALFPQRITLVALIDACHSGTMFDLPYRYVSNVKHVMESSAAPGGCRCIMISGCRDRQVSMDAFNLEKGRIYSGAMTTAFRTVLHEHEYNITAWQLLKRMRKYLTDHNFKQVPQITTNIKLLRGTLFVARNIHNPFIQ